MAFPHFPTDVSPALKAHIKSSERLMLRAYFDAAGVPTIGWGHIKTVTAADVRRGRVISETEAQRLFEADLDEAEMAVRTYVKVNLNQNQYDALTDFVFNLGPGNLRASTLLKKLNAGDYGAVPTELMRWTKARDPKTGKLRELRGLVIRRTYEAKLFAKPALHSSPPANYPAPADNEQATVSPAPTSGAVSLWTLILSILNAIFGGRRG